MKRIMKSKGFNHSIITIDPNMKDHSNDPYIVAKADRAAENVRKYGFPAEVLKIQAERMKK